MPNGNGNGLMNGTVAQEPYVYANEIRMIARDVQAGVEPVAVEMSVESQKLYLALNQELAVVEKEIALTVTPIAESVEAEVGPVLREIEAEAAPIVEQPVQETRETVRKWPILSLGLGIAGGFVIGKMLAKRGR